MKIFFPDAVHRLSTTNEWCDDGQRLSDWRLAHPYGPITTEDRAEFEELVSSEIGSYIIFCMTNEIEIDFNRIDHLWKLIEN